MENNSFLGLARNPLMPPELSITIATRSNFVFLKTTWCNWEEETHWTVLASQQQAWGDLLLGNLVSVWAFPGERCFQFWNGLRVVRHLTGKVEVAGTHWNYPKASKNRLVKHACDCVGGSLVCIMCWRKLAWSTTSARGPLTLLQLKSRGSEHSWGKWAWDPVCAAPKSNRPMSSKLTQLSTFGLSWRQKFTGLAGKPKGRISWSARSGTWTGSLCEAAWTAWRRTFGKRPPNLLRFFCNATGSPLINPR